MMCHLQWHPALPCRLFGNKKDKVPIRELDKNYGHVNISTSSLNHNQQGQEQFVKNLERLNSKKKILKSLI